MFAINLWPYILPGAVLAFVVMMLAGSAVGETVTVCAAGCNYTTVTAALTADTTDIIINVSAETFTEPNDLSISPNNVTINAMAAVFNLPSDTWLSLSNSQNFLIDGGNYTGATSDGLMEFRSGNNQNNTFRNLIIENMQYASDNWALKFWTDSSNTIVNNTLFTNITCINVYGCVGGELRSTGTNVIVNNVTFYNNNVTDTAWGFYIASGTTLQTLTNINASYNTVTNITNRIFDGAAAIKISRGNWRPNNPTIQYVWIHDNTITNVTNSTENIGQPALRDHEAIYSKADNTLIYNNVIINGGWFAIGLKGENNDSWVYNNTIIYDETINHTTHYPTTAIRNSAGTNVTIENNTIIGAYGANNLGDRQGCGIDISGYAINTTIQNNFIRNCDIGIGAACSTSSGALTGQVTITNNTILLWTFKEYLLYPLAGKPYTLTRPSIDKWANNSFYNRRDITANYTRGFHTSIGTIPYIVRLNSTNFNFSKVRANGIDISFYLNTALLPHDIDYWNDTSETAFIWVRAPNLNNNSFSHVWFNYNNSTMPTTENTTGTWADENALSVWHFTNTTINQVTDELLAHNATSNATIITGLIGQAIQLNGTTWAEEDANLVNAYPWSVCLWLEPDDAAATSAPFSMVDKSLSTRMYGLRIVSNQAQIFARNTGFKSASGGTITNGQWAHVCGVFASNTDKRLFVNGVNVANLTDSVTMAGGGLVDRWSLGRLGDATPDSYYEGTIDETRFYTQVLTHDFINFTYLSERENFYSIGNDEEHDTPTVTLIYPADQTVICYETPCNVTFQFTVNDDDVLGSATSYVNISGWTAQNANYTVSTSGTNYLTSSLGNFNNYTWNINVSDSDGWTATSTTNYTLLFVKPSLVACGGGNTTVALEFCFYDEEDQAARFGDMGVAFWVFNTDRTLNVTYNFTWNDTNCTTVCIWPTDASFLVDSFQTYEDNGTSYDPRAYFLDNATISNVTQNISLYLLESTLGTQISITLQDEGGLGVGEALIYFSRYYPGENLYRTIAMVKTSEDSGEASTYLRPNDAWHRITIVADHEVIGTYPARQIPCDPAYTSCPLTLSVVIGETGEWFSYITGFPNAWAEPCTYNETGRTLACSWVSTTGLMKYTRLRLWYFGVFNKTLICDTNTTTTSGTLLCSIPLTYNGTFNYLFAAHFAQEVTIDSGMIEMPTTATFAAIGLLPTLLLFLALAFAGLWNPTVSIVLGYIALVAAWAMMLLNIEIVALVALGVVVGMIAYKMRA